MNPAASPLAVVIPTHDRRAILERTVGALAAQSDLDFRLIVVDDGSSDGTWEWLQATAAVLTRPQLEIVRQENRGQGQARNRGLQLAGDGLVLFLGDDVIACRDLVAEHRRAHATATSPRAVVGFIDWRRTEMRVTPALEMVNREGHQFGFAHMRPGEAVPFTCFYTSNLSLPRELLGNDPFDAAFQSYGWEDVELGYRLDRRGVKLYYHPAAAAEHLHPMTLTDLFARQRAAGRGIHGLLDLHPELAGDSRLSPIDAPRWFAAGRHAIPPLVPLLSRLDRLGVPLGKRLLHRVLICGYYLGRDEARGVAA